MMPYYETENGKLYHGDCLDIMREMDDKSIDLVLTDPPYGIKISGKIGKGKDLGRVNWDNEIPSRKVFNMMFRISLHQILWGGNYFIEYLHKTRGYLIWDKMNYERSYAECELAWTNIDKNSKVWRQRPQNMDGGKVHPTQKPYNIIAKCISWSETTGLICDPFLGSGTTAVACKRLNRRWIGIEISKEYCDIAIERIKREVAQPRFA